MKNGGYLIIDISGEDFSSTVTRTDIYEALDRNGVEGKPVMIYPKTGVGGVFGQVTKSGTSYVVGFIDADGYKGTVTVTNAGVVTRVYTQGAATPTTYGTSVDLSSGYSTTSNMFLCPSDGYLRVVTGATNASVNCYIYDSGKSNTLNVYCVNGDWQIVYVRKGFYIRCESVTGSNNYVTYTPIE